MRVLPSDVVAFIEKNFPQVTTADKSHRLMFSISHRAQFVGILEMLGLVPDDLLPISGGDFLALHAARAAMQDIADYWANRGDRGINLTPGYELDPVTILWQVLKKCPDETVGLELHGLDFIADPELRQVLQTDLSAS